MSKAARTIKNFSKIAGSIPAKNFGGVVKTQDPNIQELKYGIKPASTREYDQFSKARLVDMGELPHGEIPEALNFSRPYDESKLANGLKVCTEYWPSKLATIGVFIKAGSRNETIETSGVSHFLEHLHFKGTSNRSRVKLESEIENLGGHLNAYTSRETTLYHIQVPKENVSKAVDILGDILNNSLYNKNQIEVERDTILSELEETTANPDEVMIENAHYNSFRDHMMGQPILGSRENIGLISQDMIKEFKDTHYIGNRMVMVGCGDVNHQELVDLAEKHFGKVASDSPTGATIKNQDTPAFSAGTMYMHDDDLPSTYVASFFKAPGWNDEGYYPAMLLQRIIGDYDPMSYKEINKAGNNYRSILTYLPKMISLQKFSTQYTPYSDIGLFGHIAASHEVECRSVVRHSLMTAANYANNTAQHEIYHGRNKLYHELMQLETGSSVCQVIGHQQLYWGRRVPRSEVAQRIAHITPKMLSHFANEWFYDNEFTLTSWGPSINVQGMGPYKFLKWNTCPQNIDTAKYHMKFD